MPAARWLALAFALAAPSIPGPAPQDREDFLRELAALEATGGDDAWRAGEPRLRALLAEHEGALHVIDQIERVDALLGAYAFQRATPGLDRGACLRGELTEDAKSGEVELRLAFDGATFAPGGLSGAPGDLEWSEGRWWHPLPFGGPGTLAVRGRVPESEGAEAPTDTLYARMSLGLPGSTRTTFEVAVGPLGADGLAPIRAYREEPDGTRELLGEADGTPLASGAEYELEVRVTRRRLFLRSADETLLHVLRPKSVYGRFGWVDLPGIEELRIEGEPDREWLEGLPALHRAVAFERWRSDPDRDLGRPEWIETWLATEPPLLSRDQTKRLYAIRELLDAEDFEGALARCGKERRLPAWWIDWLTTRAETGAGRVARALAAVDRVLARTPWNETALARRASLLNALGAGRLAGLVEREQWSEGLAFLASDEGAAVDPYLRAFYAHVFHGGLDEISEARDALEAALRERPDEPIVLRQLGIANQRLGRWSAALTALERAAELGDERATRELARAYLRLGRRGEAAAIVAANEGAGTFWTELAGSLRVASGSPGWADARSVRGERVEVVTPLAERHAQAVADAFDSAFDLVDGLFGASAEPDAHAPVRCFVFLSPEAFQHYRESALGHPRERVWGLFGPALAQSILQWRLPTASLRTARHEGVHAALERRFGPRPLWFEEGVATYLETEERRDPEDARELLERGDWTPCGELLRFDYAGFHSDDGRHYAQAHALVAFLVEGPDEARSAWDGAVQLIATGRRTAAVAEHVEATIPDLDGRFAAFVRGRRDR